MDQREQRRVVIVDGYSTGRELVRELLERNIECFHLQSTEQLPAAVANCFDPGPYDGNLGYLGDVYAAGDVLATIEPHAVVAGSEWGVSFAERLAHRMKLPTNRIETLSARRDKFDMIEAARRHRLLVPKQAKVSDAASGLAWADSHGQWPIVVKPVASAGSDGLSICNSRDEVAQALARFLHRRNFMGLRNDQLLLQSFLDGPQFIVNTVSRQGCHHVTDAWRMTFSILPGSAIVPEEIHLMDPLEPAARALIGYAFRVLDALGIENGAAHTELKWTTEGPALIETGARLMGAAMDRASYRAAGMQTQASVYASVLEDVNAQTRELFSKRHYAFCRHLTKLFFRFEHDGEIRGTKGLARLEGLPSFHAHYRPLATGSRVWKTADTLVCGGTVYLVHDDPLQIASDIRAIRRWEMHGDLYEVAPDPPVAARHQSSKASAA